MTQTDHLNARISELEQLLTKTIREREALRVERDKLAQLAEQLLINEAEQILINEAEQILINETEARLRGFKYTGDRRMIEDMYGGTDD